MKIYLSFLIVIWAAFLPAQEARNGAPKLFLDCQWGCDRQYLKSEITYLNFMRDRADADILVQQTGVQNGGGGSEYTLMFFGQKQFSGQNDTLHFSLPPAVPDNERRLAMKRNLERGLLPFLLQTSLAENITFSVDTDEAFSETAEEVQDPWDFWTISIRTNASIGGQEFSRYLDLFGRVNVNRVTEQQKTRFSIGGDYGRNVFEFDDTLSEIEVYENGGYYFNASEVLAINDHWSYGFFTGGRQAKYNNMKMGTHLFAAIEHNLFPYAEVAQRQLRTRYRIGPRLNQYFDESIYFKEEEWLWEHSLSIDYRQVFQWGDFNAGFRYYNYLHDFSLNRTNVFVGVDLNLFKGFRLSINGDYGLVRNQVELPNGGASKEEALLRIRQLKTGYRYGLYMGISYTFGSIYSNVINRRFGN